MATRNYFAPKKHCVLGIDIGGTKVACALYNINNGKVNQTPIEGTEREVEVAKDVEQSKAQIKEIIKEMQAEAKKNGRMLTHVGIGFPGRIREGSVLPGGAPNMKAFEEQNVQEIYREAVQEGIRKGLQEKIEVKVMNDADAQFVGILEKMLKDPVQKGKLSPEAGKAYRVVGFLGMGTGLGNAFAKVYPDGSYELVTDGHASKFLLEIDMEEQTQISHAISNAITFNRDKPASQHWTEPEMFKLEGQGKRQFVTAETIVSGTGIRNMGDGSTGEELDSNRQKTGELKGRDIKTRLVVQEGVREQAAKTVGSGMARLIQTIKEKAGEDVMDMVQDKDTERLTYKPEGQRIGWSEADKQIASEASIYIVGGGVMQGKIGDEILKYAKNSLAEKELDGIELIKGDALEAVRAAAQAGAAAARGKPEQRAL